MPSKQRPSILITPWQNTPWLSWAVALLCLAWGAAYAPLWAAAALGVTIWALPPLLRAPWLVWLASAALLPLAGAVKFGHLSANDLLLLAAIALWFSDGVRRDNLRLAISWRSLAFLLYAGLLTVISLQAIDLSEAVLEVLKWLQFAIVLLIAPAMTPARQRHWLAAALLVGGALQGLLGLYQFVFQIGPEWFRVGSFMRASGAFAQPNPYAGYLGLTWPAAASLALWVGRELCSKYGVFPVRAFEREEIARSQPAGYSLFGWGLFYTCALVAMLGGLLASWSRGAWLGAAAAAITGGVLHSRKFALLGAAATVTVLTLVLFGLFQPGWIPAPIASRLADLPGYVGVGNVLEQRLTDENFAVVERVAHWVAGLRMWQGSPWLGVGAGNYAAVYPSVREARWLEPLGHAHNIYINVLAEGGLLGLLAYLLLWGSLIAWLFVQLGRARLQHNRWRAALLIGLLGAMAHLTVHQVFDNLFVQGIYVHIALWFAIIEDLK
jgi:O-antigen ligase